jgi:hypothetical protein
MLTRVGRGNAHGPELRPAGMPLTSPERAAESSMGASVAEHCAEALRIPLDSAKESVVLMRLCGPDGPWIEGTARLPCLHRAGRERERPRHARVKRHRGQRRAGMAVGP